jgi:hypothetical protein
MNLRPAHKQCTQNLRRLIHFLILIPAIIALATNAAHAQVPADIESQLIKIGQVVDPTCTAKLYRPLFPKADISDQYSEMQKTGKPSDQTPLYPGVTIERDVSFGPDQKDVVDIFHGDKGPASRTVLIYVPGGNGNKIEIQNKEANAFYDNIGRWATENGMIAVLMQRHGLPQGAPPDFYAGAKDVSAMLQWVEKNIAQYHGNPNRMFIWAHSAANGPLGIYSGHPELYGPQGIGVKGIIFMSGQFSILREDGTNPVPQAAPRDPSAPAPPAAGATCGGVTASDGALPGKAAGQPGGPNPAFAAGAGGGAGGRGGPAIPQDELIKRSSLPGLEKTDAKIFLASAELDPGIVNAQPSAFNQALHDELCKQDGPKAKDGKGHCPTLLVMKGESHMSETMSVDSGDKTVSAPILAWIKSTK